MATTPRLPVVLLVLAAAALAAPAMADYAHPPLDPNQDWYKPYDLISFNVATDDYEQLMTNIFNLLKQDSNNRIWDWGDPIVWVLHQQAVNRKPFKWLILELVGAGDNRIMLAIRRDNLYVTGFTDRSGLWYLFSNRPRAIIPVATVFRLADDYPGLVGGSSNLKGVRVSKQTILEAVERVASFVPRDSADVGYVGRALAIMAVTFAEASRFHPFHDVVLKGWESGADVGELYVLVFQWRAVSCALMISVQEGGTWSSQEAWDLSSHTRIRTLDDAMHAVKVALWPWREKCSKTITWLE
ncbi:hypothetical protein ABZP36_000930 [Zizania latifolia]